MAFGMCSKIKHVIKNTAILGKGLDTLAFVLRNYVVIDMNMTKCKLLNQKNIARVITAGHFQWGPETT